MKYLIAMATDLPMTEIDEAQFTAIKKAKEVLLELMQVEETFNMLVENYREWEQDLNDHGLDWLLQSGDKYSAHITAMMNLNRRLMNFLGTCKFYIDVRRQKGRSRNE